MMSIDTDARFQYCIPILLNDEGGYVNNPQDPGGETKYGISKRSFPNLDIANLTPAQAESIYYNNYWLPIGGGQIPAHLDLWLFTASVMSGPTEAIKLLQQLVGSAQDGQFGPHTLAAVQQFPAARYHEYLTMFTMHLYSLGTFGTFGKGWLNRLFKLAAE
jgi:lysozyme family protein